MINQVRIMEQLNLSLPIRLRTMKAQQADLDFFVTEKTREGRKAHFHFFKYFIIYIKTWLSHSNISLKTKGEENEYDVKKN